MAEALRSELGCEVELVRGRFGEFAVYVGDELAVKRKRIALPRADAVVGEVRKLLR